MARRSSPKKTAQRPNFVVSAVGVLILCLSAIAILGFFGEGGSFGNFLAAIFGGILGRFSWFGPFVTGLIGLYLVFNQPRSKSIPKGNVRKDQQKKITGNVQPAKTAKNNKQEQSTALSKGSGFSAYFTDEDPLNEHKQKRSTLAELEELGRDFNSYFGSKASQSNLVNIGAKVKDYFAEEETACAAQTEPETPRLAQEPKIHPRPVLATGRDKLFAFSRAQTTPKESFEQLSIEQELKPVPESPSELAPQAPQPRKVEMPPLILLDPAGSTLNKLDSAAQQNALVLEEVLNSFGVKVKVTEISQGPAITRYEVQPAPGIKISRIVGLADDIALALAAADVRIEAPIPGKSAVGIEVPNKKTSLVRFREILESPEFGIDSKLKVALGKDIAGKPIVADLARMPHLLVAGATGSGKSVCMNTIITSILYTAKPEEVKLLLIDPKMVELTKYNHVPHLVAPVVTDPKKASAALRWIISEMENRYELFAAAGVRDILRYNEVSGEQQPLPYVVVLIDELADLMMVAPGDVEEAICRLAQMARAAGIHLVVATQRPSVDVITGIIKANIPSRIAFAVSSQIDSRTILDGNGAEKLLGKGDMLFYPLGMAKPLRVQGCFLSDQEVERVASHWKKQAQPQYLSPDFETQSAACTEEADDELFYEAGRLFVTSGIASVSLLQRRLRIGYTRAARLMDLLEAKEVVGGFEGSKPRQVLLSADEFDQRFGDC